MKFDLFVVKNVRNVILFSFKTRDESLWRAVSLPCDLSK